MKRAALLAILLALAACLAGCKKAGSPRLEGRWRGAKADGILPSAQQAANQFAVDTELTFEGDTVTVNTNEGKQSAKYKVVREDKRSVIIETDRDGPNDQQTFTFDSDKTMRWQVMPGKTLSFAKE